MEWPLIGNEAIPLNKTISTKSFTVALILLFLIFSLFLSRAVQLQLLHGKIYHALAQNNQLQKTIIPPARGIVTDRFGTPLVQNSPSFVLTMNIGNVPKDDLLRRELFLRVAELSGMQPTDFDLALTKYQHSKLEEIPIKRNISYESAMRLSVELSDVPAFSIQTFMVREYESSASSLSHVLGYVGNIDETEYARLQVDNYRPTDIIGKQGIEKSAEHFLRGKPGFLNVEVDARGRELSVVSRQAAVTGANITLSIDLELQKFAEITLRDAMKTAGASKGSLVIMDPHTGGVLTLISLPSYDNNAFASGIDSRVYNELISDVDEPLFPRAIAGEFPAGSTFKPFVAYAALEQDVIDSHTSFLSVGGISIGPWFFPDWKTGGHGITDVRKAIAESVNTFFYIIGGGYGNTVGLGVEKITRNAGVFGFGTHTGIDLPSEADGFLPSKAWKEEVKNERWYVGDTYHLAIGQGDLLVTPLQMAHATSMIANEGKVVIPHVIEAVDGGSDEIALGASQDQSVLDTSALSTVREGMRLAVTSGSARRMNSLPIAVAAKTGTAQTPGDKPTHAWVIAFGPYEDPKLAMAVLVENGGEGSSTAVPIAHALFDWWARNR